MEIITQWRLLIKTSSSDSQTYHWNASDMDKYERKKERKKERKTDRDLFLRKEER